MSRSSSMTCTPAARRGRSFFAITSHVERDRPCPRPFPPGRGAAAYLKTSFICFLSRGVAPSTGISFKRLSMIASVVT